MLELLILESYFKTRQYCQIVRSIASPLGEIKNKPYMREDLYEKVYKLVRSIPLGKVTTYGEIAKQLHISPRVVGQILHMNPDAQKTPCHRVVNRNGRVAPGYAFGGKGIQKEKLKKEGVEFKDELNVNLKRHFLEL